MTKKKKIIIAVCVTAAVVALVIAAFFIVRAVFFREPKIEHPFDGDGSIHTVVFDSNGGSAAGSVTVRDGNPVRRPQTPVKDGYFLIGWFEDAELTDEWNFDKDRVKRDLTLYAGWNEDTSVQPTASLTYLKEGNAYTVTGVGEETVVIIPAEHEGLPVTKIQGAHGTGAFARTAITAVTIPDSVTHIGQNTFNNCSELQTVTISAESKLQTIGNNAFSGNGALKEIFIPQGVTDIGDGAFNNCGRINFTVDSRNAVYRSENGHLIETATQTLIRGGQSAAVPEGVKIIAQAAFRKTSGATELSIPKSVVKIENYAVTQSSFITVRYAGAEEEWAAVEKARYWCGTNTQIEIIYN